VIVLAEELAAGKVRSVVTGGDRRAASVRAALAETPDEAAVIVVHDAARPLLTDEVLGRVIAPLSEGYEGAVPVLPVADTVKRVEREEVVETLDREGLVVSQTPQAFLADALRRAASGEGTDCAALVEAQGGRIKAVAGDPRLVKVTSPDDLELVASWL
jgi:2-C-methyl-D-erythritol 4-phosphate cytidylyltransferase